MKNTNVYFVSLGCSRNLVDSEVMLSLLRKEGFSLTLDVKKADFFVINTCGFLKEARDEGVAVLKELFSNRKRGAKVVVTGCMVQSHLPLLKENFPNINFYLSSTHLEEIAAVLKSGLDGERIKFKSSFLENSALDRFITTPPHFAYLKVAEGCKKRCSYCLIPEIKGPLRSKTIQQVALEFRSLLEKGVFEVALVAQDLGDFGKDRGKKELVELIEELLRVGNDFWLRLLYVYPDEIDAALLDLFKDSRLVPYIDMPIQHVSDKILKRMRRTTSKERIIELVESLRKVPDMSIRTSLMVGFPGEEEADFVELLNFVEMYKLENVGIFKYSREERTDSFHLDNQLPEEVKEERYQRLAVAQEKIMHQKAKSLIGQTKEAILDGFHPDSNLLIKGRLKGQCLDVDPVIIVNDIAKVSSMGRPEKVIITASSGPDVIANVL